MSVNAFKQECNKIIAHLQGSFKRLQLWRASTGLVDDIHVYVESWGQHQKMNQIANISTLDAQTLKIEPWDKSVLSDIEKAVYDADIWLTPQNQGDYVMIKVPQLNEERRKELTKIVSRDWEDAKIALRNKRHDVRKEVEKAFDDDEISENEKNAKENTIDDIIKEYNAKVDELVTSKKDDVMKI